MTTVPAARPPVTTAGGSWRTWAAMACLLAAGWIVLRPLSASWNFFSNYAYGWSVPFLAALLFVERWGRRPAPARAQAAIIPFILVWGLLFLGLRMAVEVSMVARPLSLACALMYIGALLYALWIYGGRPWARHFLFPVGFLLLGVPWPLQIENPVVQGLAPFNAWLVAHVLVDFGIFAQASGQVIVLPNCTLGVKEACSGLRSLQAALMMAFLLGELFRFSWARRGGLVLLALGLALLGNVLRTLFLALIAFNQGVPAVNRWHDAAGGFILVFTSAVTFLIAYYLQRRDGHATVPSPGSAATPDAGFLPRERPALKLACGILVAALVAEAATQGWFAWRDRGATHYPAWTIRTPATPTLQNIPIDRESRDILKYDAGQEIKWQDDQRWLWTAYWFRYDRKPWAVSAFTNHNPAKCLPAVGYRQEAAYAPFTTEIHGAPLWVQPFRFTWQNSTFYVFWVVYADRSNFPLREAAGFASDAPWAKGRFFFSNIWSGGRGASAKTESLEIIIQGPDDFPAARSAYLDELQNLIVPDSPSAEPGFARSR